MVSPQRVRVLRAGHLEDHAQNYVGLRTALGSRTDGTRTERPDHPIWCERRESISWRPVGWNGIRGVWARALQLQLREVLSLDDSASPRHHVSTGSEDGASCGVRVLLRP